MKRPVRAGVPAYTYKQDKTEEKTIRRRLFIVGGLTLVLILIIWFWGVTFVQIIGALGINETESDTVTTIEIPLQKPNLQDLPEFTNKEKITISGTTSPALNLTLLVNGTQVGKTLSDKNGSFSFINVQLKEDINLIKVIASKEGGETQETRALITLDKTKPQLIINSPVNGQTFPKETSSITIKGKSEADAIVMVNSIQAILDQDGNFSYTLSISSGENKIEITAADKAGNVSTEKLTVTVEK